MIDCDCPRCGSKNTKAFSVLYANGMRQSTYRRDGLFYYRGSIGVHASTTRGQSQTLTSQQAAPPETARLSPGVAAIILFLGTLLGGTTGFWITLAALFAFMIFGDTAKAQKDAYEDWSSTFRCNRCGTIFAVVSDTVRRHEPRPQR